MRMQIDRMIHEENQLLGPENRVILWMHGCHRQCAGCIAAERNQNSSQVLSLSIRAIMDYVLQKPIEGITVSGGEPFLQSEALAELTHAAAEKKLGIILYTGYQYEELLGLPFAKEILQVTDTLIDGPYIQELDDGKPFRGSSNQKIHLLTERYADFYQSQNTARSCNIIWHGSYCELNGIPDKASRSIWKKIQSKGDLS